MVDEPGQPSPLRFHKAGDDRRIAVLHSVEAVADVSYNGLQAYDSELPLAESMRAM